MAFGGGSSFTFGSNNNNNQGSTFSGFGSNTNNTSSGFGQSSGGGLFGSNNNNATPSTFGGSSTFGGGGFGTNNTTNSGSSLFGGNKTATGFGSGTNTSGGGLFGTSTNNNNTSSSGGLFGNNTTNTSTSNVFGGSSTTGGGLFGASNTSTNNSPFGSSQNKGLFGQGGAGTTGGFTSSSPFGSGAGTALNAALPPCQGTASPPFEPFNETEANGSKSSFQTITFMQPYSKYSLEELRLADYVAGRRYGTGGGGTGAFGQTNFSGFGSNSGGAFGSNNTSTPFGQSTSGTAFSGNTATSGSTFGGGLFGNSNNQQQNKPGGLFGASNTATTGTGGLFGSTSNNQQSGGLFGNTNNNQQQQSGGLFGNNNNNNNNNQNKPGGLFGSTATNNTTGGFSFGNNTNNATTTGGGLFGNTNTTTNTGGGLFGNANNQQQTNTGGGLFGSPANNNQANTTGGLFGNKTNTFGTSTTGTQQTGGLFGGTNNNSSGGLFGNTNTNTNTGGGLFGNTNNSQQSGGLFGNNNQNNQNKPGGLFGGNTSNTGGSLFGNPTTSNNTGGGLFGNTNNNQQSGGLFSNNNNNNNNAGGGLFGNNQAQNKPGGLFTNSTNNQGGSLFGNPTGGGMFNQSQSNQQQAQQQPDFKVSSLLDPNPYGQSSIWTGLPAPTPENAKPVFTPLTATQKLKESAMKPIPSLRLNQSRYMTPPRRNGYGFSYSTYGTPSSVSSTPGTNSLASSMYGSRGWSGGSFGRSFSKSASVQNLRAQYDSNSDEIFKPHSFTPGHRNSSGSIKRLTIDRNIRNDLFSKPVQPALPAPKPAANGTKEASPPQEFVDVESTQKLKKRVSFENDIQSTHLNGTTGALVRTEEDSDSDDTPPRRLTNGETDSGRNGELAAVPEDQATNHVSSASRSTRVDAKTDPKPGDYWMEPTRQEMAKMPREQLQNFKGFKVGRNGCGEVTFDGSVDLTSLPLDDLYENIVEIRVRAVTVYPDANKKPPVGRGLNVPSTIKIQNSWPRNRGGQPSSETSGPVFDKHVNRLKKMVGTEFVSYDPPTGVWTFKVPHYTRYGLDYDDEDEMDQSELSLPPTSLDKSADAAVMEVDNDNDSFVHESDDDTFAFKKSVPGGYGRQSMIDYDSEPSANDHASRDERSEHSDYSEDEYMSEDEVTHPMPGSLPPTQDLRFDTPTKPVLKPPTTTPGKPLLDLEGDWADQLQRTISPRKQNRDVLRDAQSRVLLDRAYQPIKPKQATQTSFKNSIDIMNSLFEPSSRHSQKSKKVVKAPEPDFEFPYAKRAKTFDAQDNNLTEVDRVWHDSLKPHFATDGTFLYKSSEARQNENGEEQGLVNDQDGTVYRAQIVGHSKFNLQSALRSVDVQLEKGIPTVEHRPTAFSNLANRSKDSSALEDVYLLAHVLFDEYDDDFNRGMKSHVQKQFQHRIRKDRLTAFLSKHILQNLQTRIGTAEQDDPTTAAFLRLTAHDVSGACSLLAKIKNHRLMLLISQLDGVDEAFMEDIVLQLNAWRDQNVLSEITEDTRALYELCAGNVTISQGKTKGAIPVEDRATTFAISEKFRLSWLQAFALGLWYGKEEKLSHKNTDNVGRIEDAVREFQARIDRGEESAKPGNDPMWTLLRLYAAQQADSEVLPPVIPADLLGLIAPATPFDSSALFELANALKANLPWLAVDKTKLDTLAEMLAFELSARGDLASAIFALLHLSSANVRKLHITDLLHRFAPSLPGADTATTDAGIALWQTLTINLRVPQAWIYNAKAAFAASQAGGMDNIAELKWLVAAEEWNHAHKCFVKRVAPAAVVDEDWQAVLDYARLFGESPAARTTGWQDYNGGGVFEDLASLMTKSRGLNVDSIEALRRKLVRLGQAEKKKKQKDVADATDKNKPVQLGKLSIHELDQHVALREMSRHVADLLANSSKRTTTQQKEILQMPLTSDIRLAQSFELAAVYFENVISRTGGTNTASNKGKHARGGSRASERAIDDDVNMENEGQTA